MSELSTELLNKMDVALAELEKEISELPSKQVWTCQSTDQIEDLITRMEGFIDYCYMSMAGTLDRTRDILNGMIDMATDEKAEAKEILYGLKGDK